MLEIIGVIFLARLNSKNAKMKQKSGGGAIMVTLLLWFGLEVVGFIIGIQLFYADGVTYASVLDIPLAYILGLAFAGIGGYISYRIYQVKPTDINEQTEIEID